MKEGEKMHLSTKASRKLINIATIVCGVAIVLLVIYWYRLGIFTDQAKMRAYLANKQIVGPIIPGGVSLLGGVVFFGPVAGFIYNYVGICIGSIINFFLARHYGRPFILHIVSEETLDKYMKWTENQNKFNWFFALCILAPAAPDDVLCLLAGLTKMKFWTYFWIIILCKPWTIAAYSIGLQFGAKWLLKLMGN